MRGKKNFNFPAFHAAAANLRGKGYTVISPAEHDEENGFSPTEREGMTGNEDLKDILDVKESLMWDLEQVSNCDKVAVLPGSGESLGTKAEIALANALGIPVCDYSRSNLGWPYVKTLDSKVSQPTVTLSKRQERDLLASTFTPGVNLPSQAFPAYRYGDPVHVPEEYILDKDTVQQIGKKGLEYIKKSINGEVRTTSSTGGQKGSKPQRYDLIPAGPLKLLAELYGKGAEKYDERNWEKGYDWHLSYAAAQRHMNQWWAGEDIDEETGIPHPINAVFHMFGVTEFMTTHPEFDDRPKK
jgi:hypothetical protein